MADEKRARYPFRSTTRLATVAGRAPGATRVRERILLLQHSLHQISLHEQPQPYLAPPSSQGVNVVGVGAIPG